MELVRYLVTTGRRGLPAAFAVLALLLCVAGFLALTSQPTPQSVQTTYWPDGTIQTIQVYPGTR